MFPSTATATSWQGSASSSPTFSAPSYTGFSVNGAAATRLTYNLEQSNLGQVTGSRTAVYKQTAAAPSSVEKLASISAMPAYSGKSHEELRWEDCNVSGKGLFGLSSSAVQSRSPATNLTTASWGTTSVSSTPVKPNLFEKAFPSVATQTPTWNYPGPSTFPPSQPLNFSNSANTGWTTVVTSAPSSSFNPFTPRTNLTSPASNASSVSFVSWNNNPFTNPSTSLASTTHTSSSSFNPFMPRTGFTSPTSTTSSVSLAPLNHNPFTNPFTSVPSATHTSSSSLNPFMTRTSFTSPASTTSSVSLAPLNHNPFTTPFTSVASHTSSSSFNLFTPRTNLTSPASTASSFSFAPTNNNPFTSSSTSLATDTSSSSFNLFRPGTNFNPPASTAVNAAPLSLFNSSGSGTTLTSAASVSLSPLNHNPFSNPSTSLAAHTSSSYPTFTAFTRGADSTPSSLNALWSTPIDGPFVSTSTAADKLSLVAPVSSGLNSTFNQPTTLFNPCVNGTSEIIGQSSFSQPFPSQIKSTGKPSSATSPFGTLPPIPHMVFDGSQSKQSIQYGISSLPVKDKPAPVKYSLPNNRHLSGRIKLPVRKYDPKLNASKKPYFSVTKEIPVAVYAPRENPRALMVCPEKWPPKDTIENIHEENFSGSIYESERDGPAKDTQLFTTVLDVPSKLQQPDYYTHPHISELEAKERAAPGFCMRVKDFVVGRHGYGSIKFLGETNLRKVDIETHVQFNNREVIVYTDESKKPPVGEGLNKAAEITLLNIKCVDKKTGMQYTEGSKVDKYTEMLKKKAAAQGAEFISYDPIQGEWKFRVQHF
ncbi:hypothetical protein QVD17_00298 [Tagetes erecta]|uniref:Peptidase S59 domain-containing protein n=1 Tax=Tagetes erecta TaxID=13708 RepID=A0AAD8P793_TARER|nr:hypothetical protein QVD17_00298 [Tagetes erecta]